MERTEAAPRTAFVLGGGGKWGSAQVGMLAALAAHGVAPDLVLGCSIGAINGAAFAADPTIDGVERLRSAWAEVADSSAFSLRPRPRRALRGNSIGDPAVLVDLIGRTVPARRFDELPVRFECVAASIEDADERWFSDGPLADALLASASIPGLFPPAEIAGRHYYDGGLVNSIPVDRAAALGATRVFVLQVGRVEQPLRPPRRLHEAAMVAFEIARRHRYATAMRELASGLEVHVLPTGDPVAFDDLRQLRVSDTTGAMERMATAERASVAYLSAEGP